MIPTYGNLGDLAIATATRQLVERLLPDDTLMELNDSDTIAGALPLRRALSANDLVILPGGGNLGSSYPKAGDERRLLLGVLPKSQRCLIFPQSTDYPLTARGRRFLAADARAFARHRNLVVFARDLQSYQFIVRHFDNQAHLVPDTALALAIDATRHRIDHPKRAIISLRSDDERRQDTPSTNQVILELRQSGYQAKVVDTQARALTANTPAARQRAVTRMIDLYASAQIVITDRLHGMIFAAIAGTPAVVFDNANSKVRHFFDSWSHGLQGVIPCWNDSTLERHLTSIPFTNTEPPDWATDFAPLIAAMTCAVKPRE
jgi:pyruvyl transferase EpsI